MNDFYAEIKKLVIETLDITDVDPDKINIEDQLVGGTLGIDSIDVLELVMMMEERFGIKIDNKELGAKVFATIKTLADYITEHRTDRS